MKKNFSSLQLLDPSQNRLSLLSSPKLVTPSWLSWATLWVILSFLDGSRANENAVSTFSLFLTATRAWRFIKFHDCRLAFHRDEPRYTETMMAIAILEESRLYRAFFARRESRRVLKDSRSRSLCLVLIDLEYDHRATYEPCDHIWLRLESYIIALKLWHG